MSYSGPGNICFWYLKIMLSIRQIIPLVAVLLLYLPARAQDQYFTDESAWRLPDTAIWSHGADVGDIDGDGDYDVCVATDEPFTVSKSYLLTNNGQGFFTCETDTRIPPGGYDSHYNEFGDVDDDGDLDLYNCITEYPYYDFLYINDGLGFFSDEQFRIPVFDNGTPTARFADFTGDFSLDILVEGHYIDFEPGTRLLANDGAGYFSDMTMSNLPVDTFRNISCSLIDIDNDLDLDIIEGNYDPYSYPSYIPWLLVNIGDGHFSNDFQAQIPRSTLRFTVPGDIDLDGDLDVFTVIGSQIHVWINDGGGYFVDEYDVRLPPDFDPTGSFHLGLADFDNDGDIDVFVGRAVTTVARFLVNDGSGYFTMDNNRLPNSVQSANWIEPFDADGDGDLDIFICCSGDGRQKLFINHSTPDTIPPNILTNTIYEGIEDSVDYYAVYLSSWDNISIALGELTGKLRYRINYGNYVELDLLPLGGTIFGEKIPGQPSGTRIEYYMVMIDRMGNTTFIPEMAPDSVYTFWVEEITGIDESESIPAVIQLSVYPNPFNAKATITIKGLRGGDVGIGIYDIQGRLIKEQQARDFQGGDKKAVWDATDNSGRRIPSGIYFVRVVTPQTVETQKILFLR